VTVKKLVLSTIPILLAILACSDIVPLGPDTSAKCSYVQKEHIGLYSNLNVNCNLNKPCRASVSFAGVFWSDSITMRQDFCISTTKFEYLYKKGDYEIKVHMNTHVDMSLDSDDHVRFSLFDSKNVEKSYDIDLSEIIHSYSILGDSVKLTLPDFVERAAIYRSKGPDGIIELITDSLSDNTYTFLDDSLYFPYYIFDYGLKNQSSLRTDSINVHGKFFFK
jgi:hypothetical protein